ncbi:MAG: O-antigen ligase family protein, partial [Planctomycetes bacterium]|nr:O-antigen ligase family protein [Planctomycetota bacterium]
SEPRRELWQALLRAVPDFRVLGTGFGTHEYVYPLYLQKWYPTRFTHAENSYLQLLVEGGIATAVLVVAALGTLAFWCLRSLRATRRPEAKPCTLAIAAALGAAAVHGGVDFVWYIPSHAFVLAVLSGLALAVNRVQRPGKVWTFPPAPRGWVGMGTVALGLLLAAWLTTSYHHARAALYWTTFQQSASPNGTETPDREGASADMAVLRDAMAEWPDNPMYTAALAECARQKFLHSEAWQRSSMPLLQLRAAVEASPFPTPEARDRWLTSTYGPDNRTLLGESQEQFCQTARLCPLNAYAYLRLAELHFLAPPGGPSIAALLEQAVKARPYDPDLHYEAGVDYLNQGNMVQAMHCWRQSALVSENYQQIVLAQLAEVVPLAALVEHFQPDFASLMALTRERFSGKDQRGARLYLLDKARELTLQEVDPKVIGPRMRELHYAFLAEGARQKAGQCARVAVAAEPDLVSTRLILIRWLVQQGSFPEAKKELEWCALRDPEEPEVRILRENVFEALADHRRRPAAVTEAQP